MRARWTLLTAALLASVLASPSSGAPIIDWDPAYFYEPGATDSSSIAGSEMKIVGIISAFGPPLQFLDASNPALDYTFFISGLISNGTVTIGPQATRFFTTTYQDGGTITVYEGTPRDAVFDPNPPNANVPSTFTNGTVLLTGTVNGFYTQTNNFSAFKTGNAEADIVWTGGSLIGAVGGANPCPALFTGGITWLPSVSIAGYVFRHDGKIDHECPTSTRSSTWGRMKRLYR